MSFEHSSATFGVSASQAIEAGALLDTLLVSDRLLFAYLDPAFNYVAVSRAYARAAGCDAQYLVGRNHFDLFPDESRKVDFERALATGVGADGRAESLAGGRDLASALGCGSWRLTPVADGRGEVSGLLLVATAAGEDTGTLEALRSSEAHFRRLIETAAAIPWEMELPAWRFTYVGPQAVDILGYPVETWYEPGFWESHLHPDDREPALRYCRDATDRGEDHQLEYRMPAADGRVVWIHDSVQVVTDESGPVKLQGLMFDVTSRRHTEEALRESEQKYRSIFDNAQVGLWRTRVSDGQLLECNERLARMFGYANRADAIRNLRTSGSYVDSGTRERMIAEMDAHGEVNNFEARMIRKDGAAIWVRYSAKLDRTHGYMEGVATDITKEKDAVESLRASERDLSNILDSMQDTYYRTDPEGTLLRASASVEQLLGYRPDELVGTKLQDLYVMPDAREAFLAALEAGDGKVRNYETALRHRDGRIVWVSTNAQRFFDEHGRLVGVEGTTRDVTESREAEIRMRKLSGALEQSADAVMVTDREGVIEYVNPAFETTTGYARDEAVGRRPSLLKSGAHSEQFYRQLWQTILAGEVFQDVFVNRQKDGTEYYEEKTISPIKGPDGAVTHFVATGKDITERMQTQERLQYLAHHDVLTGLPNRALFVDRLEHALARSHDRQFMVALLFVDLDRFKVINDTLGHDVGDHALRELAVRLSGCVREGDTVARLGGDEFAVLLEDVTANENIAPIASKLLDALSRPFEWQRRELFITASIGISLAPIDGQDPKTLLRHADIAMYRAKDLGRNTYRFYSADMSAKAFERLSMETSLRHALARDEFALYYQPQVDAATGRLMGLEALLRWRHPELGLVDPGDFIPILEETGLILAVGEWVLRHACRQAQIWQDAGYPAFRLAVNLSSGQFNAAGLPSLVADVLADTGLDPRCLELEITEGVLVHHGPETTDTFRALAGLNVRLAIDDFGTGYSSLSYLKRFAIDTLKIDRTFVSDVTRDADDAAIVQAIIAMARRLNIQVIAEGVETEEQREFLREQGCEMVQGLLFGGPLSVQETEGLLRQAGGLN